MSLAGILSGLKLLHRKTTVLGVVVGADPTGRLDRYAPEDWRDAVTLVEAGIDYHKAVEANPRNPDAHTRLATTLLAMHQPEEALKHLNAAVELDPKSADLHGKDG
ncbi:MAG: tetratricopeptide repeat protein, partial [Desulfomonilia bacterium]